LWKTIKLLFNLNQSDRIRLKGDENVKEHTILNNEKVEFEIIIPTATQNILTYSEYSPTDFIQQNKLNYNDRDNEFFIEYEDLVEKIDQWDIIMSILSGTIAAALDILYIKDFDIEKASEWGKKEVTDFVLRFAQNYGYKGDNLKEAIKKLEEHFPIPSDKLTSEFGGGLQHHLRDFAHHPTLLGLVFSILTQYTGRCFGTDTAGHFIIHKLPKEVELGKNTAEKIYQGVIIWICHLVSDMAGSSSSKGRGTGIPGPLLSFVKEVSALPFFRNINIEYKDNDIEFTVFVSKLFNGTYLKGDKTGNNISFDLRTEIGILHEVSKQAFPVLLNECIVRSLFAIRRFYFELKDKNIETIKDLESINILKFLPFNNENLNHMLTISLAIFSAVDMGEAALSTFIKSKMGRDISVKDFVVRVNILGLGRLVIAGKVEIDTLLRKRNIKNQQESKIIPELSKLTLDYDKARILYSLELLKATYDIEMTKNLLNKEYKMLWIQEWRNMIMHSLNANSDFFYEGEAEVANAILLEIMKNKNNTWMYIVTLEICLFTPYYLLGNDNDEKYKGLKFKFKYMMEKYAALQTFVSIEEAEEIMKMYRKFKDILTGATRKRVATAVGTVLVTAATGGAAFAFAPQIAVSLVGGSLVGLHGTALTSASLALIGGGSLVVGGLGMAGGTAIIAGGGALLGLASGSATSMAATLLMSSEGYTLNECCKLLTFSKYVLTDKLNDEKMILALCKQIDDKINFTIENINNLPKTDENQKKVIKEVKKSISYLEKTSKELRKL